MAHQTSLATNNQTPQTRRRRAWLRWVGVALVVFFAMELLIRHLPPDGVQITRVDHFLPTGVTNAYNQTTTRTSHNAATVNAYNDVLNTAPITGSALPFLQGNCADLAGFTTYTITLTWHGLPVQVWDSYGCNSFHESSGGIPNLLWSRAMPQQDQVRLLQ